MKIDYKSLFLGVALGVVGVFSTLFLLGDVKTEFSFKTDEHANKMDKNIDVRIEKTIKNGQDFINIVVKGSGDITKDELDEKFVTSADNLFSANSKESFVLVEFSKNRFTIFFPFNIGTFLIGLSKISLNKKPTSIIFSISSFEVSSNPIKCFIFNLCSIIF